MHVCIAVCFDKCQTDFDHPLQTLISRLERAKIKERKDRESALLTAPSHLEMLILCMSVAFQSRIHVHVK